MWADVAIIPKHTDVGHINLKAHFQPYVTLLQFLQLSVNLHEPL